MRRESHAIVITTIHTPPTAEELKEIVTQYGCGETTISGVQLTSCDVGETTIKYVYVYCILLKFRTVYHLPELAVQGGFWEPIYHTSFYGIRVAKVDCDEEPVLVHDDVTREQFNSGISPIAVLEHLMFLMQSVRSPSVPTLPTPPVADTTSATIQSLQSQVNTLKQLLAANAPLQPIQPAVQIVPPTEGQIPKPSGLDNDLGHSLD